MLNTQLQQVLDTLNESSVGIEASALISVDGLMITSALLPNIDEDRIGAMSAALLSLGDRVGKELARGAIDRILVQGAKGYVIMTAAGSEAVLTVMAKANVNVGLTFHEIKRAAESLSTLL